MPKKNAPRSKRLVLFVQIVVAIAVIAGIIVAVQMKSTVIGANPDHYRMIADMSSRPVVFANDRGEITYVNWEAEKVFGDVVGKKATVLMTDPVKDYHEANIFGQDQGATFHQIKEKETEVRTLKGFRDSWVKGWRNPANENVLLFRLK